MPASHRFRCVCVHHTHAAPRAQTHLGSLLLIQNRHDRNTKCTPSAFLFVYRLYIGLKISPENEEHDAAAAASRPYSQIQNLCTV